MNENTLISILTELQNQNIVMLEYFEALKAELSEMQIKLNYDFINLQTQLYKATDNQEELSYTDEDYENISSLSRKTIANMAATTNAIQEQLISMHANLARVTTRHNS